MSTVVNGKGSKPRITDYEAFRRGCDEIDWHRPEEPRINRKTRKVYGAWFESGPAGARGDYVDNFIPFFRVWKKNL